MAMLVNRSVGTFLKNSRRSQISLLELKIRKWLRPPTLGPISKGDRFLLAEFLGSHPGQFTVDG